MTTFLEFFLTDSRFTIRSLLGFAGDRGVGA